jgi:hypothetical protein
MSTTLKKVMWVVVGGPVLLFAGMVVIAVAAGPSIHGHAEAVRAAEASTAAAPATTEPAPTKAPKASEWRDSEVMVGPRHQGDGDVRRVKP